MGKVFVRQERGGIASFWAVGWIALALSILLAKDKRHYSEVIISCRHCLDFARVLEN